jgi:hypothetical protein
LENRRESDQPTTSEPSDDLVREPLPPEPRSPRSRGRVLLLSALAALLVVTVGGASVLVIHDLGTSGGQPTNAPPAGQATATVKSSTPTPVVSSDPQANGWTQEKPAGDDIKFSASSVQRGYLCGTDQSGQHTFGVTTNGGQTWGFGQSPAAYDVCSIQISPTNPLDLVIYSTVEAGPVNTPHADAHSSSDGGKTWKAAPVAQTTTAPGGALWSAAYLYVWSGADESSGQSSFLKVSANGGPFASLDLNWLLPGAQNVSIASAVVSSTTLYLNLTYSGCPAAAQACLTIVASRDGGKTWSQASNQAGIRLVYVVGNTLYGQVTAGATATLVRSTDDGATWIVLTIPPLPGGQTVRLSDQGAWLPAPDGTIFTAPFGLGVAYLRAGAWTIVPFSSDASLDAVVAVSFAPNGQPQRIWGVSGPQAASHGIYWHAYP